MLPTARPLVSCSRNCRMGGAARGGTRWPGRSPRVGPRGRLRLQHEAPARVDLVDAVQLAHPVALRVEGDLAGVAGEVLEPGHQVIAELVLVGRPGGLDGAGDHPEAVAGQDPVDRAGRLAPPLLV